MYEKEQYSSSNGWKNLTIIENMHDLNGLIWNRKQETKLQKG